MQDVQDSEFLYQFPWCQVATAFILQDLNRQRKVEGKVCVTSTAANKMMLRYHYAVLGALQYKSANPIELSVPSAPAEQCAICQEEQEEYWGNNYGREEVLKVIGRKRQAVTASSRSMKAKSLAVSIG
jgi:hypothetical protein